MRALLRQVAQQIDDAGVVVRSRADGRLDAGDGRLDAGGADLRHAAFPGSAMPEGVLRAVTGATPGCATPLGAA